jgi:hypothetical protein
VTQEMLRTYSKHNSINIPKGSLTMILFLIFLVMGFLLLMMINGGTKGSLLVLSFLLEYLEILVAMFLEGMLLSWLELFWGFLRLDWF